MMEEVIKLGENNGLIGILTNPDNQLKSKSAYAFIFLNSGLIHRIGFSRVHVEMARGLSAKGFLCFRMDFSGIGDSMMSNDNLEMEHRQVKETREAMDFLTAKTGIKQFILVGNCSGAEISFMTARLDQRVVAATLINPMASTIPLAYYIKLGFSMPAVWIRFIMGRVKFKDLFDKIHNKLYKNKNSAIVRKALTREEAVHEIRELIHRGCRLFIIHCQWDPYFDFYRKMYKKELSDLLADKKIKVAIIKGMNHDFFLTRGLQELDQLIQSWSTTFSDPSPLS